ncbi:MAG: histidine--tRNA ligase [Rhabdochlamydiaceae bacterium]
MEHAAPKGTFDILPYSVNEKEEWCLSHRWQYIESVIRQTAKDYNFQEIRTPIFEKTDLFLRAVGETSDIVSKEMYTFDDKGGRSLTLRPEGTAAVMRAFVEHQLQQKGAVHKLFYIGPMFRYERPQSGRYRQHHQFGAEVIGISGPEQDAETIDFLCEVYRRLGLKNFKVLINSLGDQESRESYLKSLRAYLLPYLPQLSSDSQYRFEKNILRILDSKDEQDRKILEGAPKFQNHLNEDCLNHFLSVQKLLTQLNIEFEINSNLVRGLDYYNKTVFEVVAEGLGSQISIGGGGRYDGMISSFGGPPLPTFGFGTGMERLLKTMIHEDIKFPTPPRPFIYLIGLGEGFTEVFRLSSVLRKNQIPCDLDLSPKKLQNSLQKAFNSLAEYIVIIGSEEIANQKIQIKHASSKKTLDVSFAEFINKCKELYV